MSHLKQFTHFQPGGRIHPANSARNYPPSCNSLSYNDFKPGENSTRRENSAQFKVLDTKELLNPANPAPLKGECLRALAARAHPSPRAGKVQSITPVHRSPGVGSGDVEVPPRARDRILVGLVGANLSGCFFAGEAGIWEQILG